MKKVFIIISICTLCILNIKACSTCGCSAGGSSIGILPQFNKHFVGIRFYNRSFTSTMSHTSLNNKVTHSNEHFSTVELFARFYPTKNLQILLLFPYNYFIQKEGNTTFQTNGIGDPTIIANYVIINTAQTSKTDWKHNLLAGAGIKLPLGKFKQVRAGETDINSNLQNGTGSTDFILDMMYTLRRKSIGLNAEVSYKYNLANSYQYHFGNRINSSLSFFYWISKKKVTVLPQLGLNFEHAQADNKMKAIITQSGGNGLYLLPGLDIYVNRFAIGTKAFVPTYQNYANNLIKSHTRWMAHFLINF